MGFPPLDLLVVRPVGAALVAARREDVKRAATRAAPTATTVVTPRKPDRCVREALVGLRLGPRLVVGTEIFDRAFAQKRARQDHHADEAGGAVARALREHRLRSAFVPGAARAVAGRGSMGVDPNAALEQAADAGPLMPVQEGAAAGRKRHAVAAQQQIACRQRLGTGRELWSRAHPASRHGTVGRICGRELEAPAGDATAARCHGRRPLPVPGLAVARGGTRDRGRAVHDEDQPRQRRQRGGRGRVGENIFVEPQDRRHGCANHVYIIAWECRRARSPPPICRCRPACGI